MVVSVSIDTEEDDWGSYAWTGARTRNIGHLIELQDLFDESLVRPTYLVNYSPLVDHDSVRVLGELSGRESVEVGAHCHPWNTPPYTGEGAHRSMMSALSTEENLAKIREVGARLRTELGVQPRVFRAGRWGFGPTVAEALLLEGYAIDSSVTPFMDWRTLGGPDYTDARTGPYRFEIDSPLLPSSSGPLIELPATIGFLNGDFRRAARIRHRLESGRVTRRTMVGPLDRLGLFAKRWLSPENSTGRTMVRLAEACLAYGQRHLQLTFHSSTLLPGATPFVKNDDERAEFLRRLRAFFSYCKQSGHTFVTLSEMAAQMPTG